MRSIILLRTSTTDQNPKLQHDDCINFNLNHKWDLINTFEKQESAYKTEDIWAKEIKYAIKNNVSHVIVWNMDRYSREPEDIVLNRLKMLSLMHNIQIHAVNGDAWSEIAESIGKLNSLGFIGKALSEFLETLIKGLEHQRAHKESKVKSERIKLAVKKKPGEKTRSYKGKKWGRKSIPKQAIKKILDLRNSGMSMRNIANEVKIYDKHGNAKNISKSVVHKTIQEKTSK